MYKILLVGGIKGYDKYHNDIIEILHKLNNDVSVCNTSFITLQPYTARFHFASDLYIGNDNECYFIVNDGIMKNNNNNKFFSIDIELEEFIEFDKSLNNSFDYVVTEHAWYCNSIEILKYHNLLKLGGYLIRFTNGSFPNSDISYVDRSVWGNRYIEGIHNVRNNIFLRNIENIFERTHPYIYTKTKDIYYDIEYHSIKYEEHIVNYLLQI